METTMDCCESRASPATTRRSLLLGGASFAAWAYLPKFARAADGRDPRLIVVILRGALDGLATVAPIGDPDYAGLHGSIALASSGPKPATMLDSFFGLHPAMPEFARMYRDKRAAVIHAVATSYRERSHFDGQDVLESGFAGPGRVQSGWLNRALESLPRGERVMSALAVGPTTPLVLRGAAATVGWAPVALPQAADDTATRLIDLYSQRDPALAKALTAGLQLDKAAQGDDMKPKPGMIGAGAMRLVARGAAKLMSADDGPRIAALAFDGWDLRDLSELIGRRLHERQLAVLRQHQQQVLIGQQDELAVAVASALPLSLAVLEVDAREDAAVEAERMAFVNDEVVEVGLQPVRGPALFDGPSAGSTPGRDAAHAHFGAPEPGTAADENVAVRNHGRLHDAVARP